MSKNNEISRFIASLGQDSSNESMDAIVLSVGGSVTAGEENGRCENGGDCSSTTNKQVCLNHQNCNLSINNGTCTNPSIISPSKPNSSCGSNGGPSSITNCSC